jgi:hypothetical protein
VLSVGLGGAGRRRKGGRDGLVVGCLLPNMGQVTAVADAGFVNNSVASVDRFSLG